MLQNKFSHFVAYFRQLAHEHTEIKDFVHGTAADVMGRSRSDLAYPLLWLETPYLKFRTNDVGHTEGVRASALIILWNAPGKTAEEIDLVWEQTEEIALDVLARMKQDAKARLFKFNLADATLDPISTLFIDNDYGWRVEFGLDKTLLLCYEPAKWNKQ